MWSRIKAIGKQFQYDESELPFLEHLDSFRTALIRMVVSLMLGILICLPFADNLIRLLRVPAEPYIEKPNSVLLAEEGVRVSFSASSFKRSISDSGDVQIEADVIVPEGQLETGFNSIAVFGASCSFKDVASSLFFWRSFDQFTISSFLFWIIYFTGYS